MSNMNINDVFYTMSLSKLNELIDKPYQVQIPANGMCQPKLSWKKHGYIGYLNFDSLKNIFKFYERDLTSIDINSLENRVIISKKITKILHGVKRLIAMQKKVNELWSKHLYPQRTEVFAGTFARTRLLVKNTLDKPLITLIDSLIASAKKVENKELITELELIKTNNSPSFTLDKSINIGKKGYDFIQSFAKKTSSIISPAIEFTTTKLKKDIFPVIDTAIAFTQKHINFKFEKKTENFYHFGGTYTTNFGGFGNLGDAHTQFGRNFNPNFFHFNNNQFPNNPYNFDSGRTSFNFNNNPQPKPQLIPDPYVALGLSKDASDEQIKKKYHKLARRYHPDKNSDPKATIIMQKINNAYDILSDPKKRSEYDTTLNMNRPFQNC